MLVRRIS